MNVLKRHFLWVICITLLLITASTQAIIIRHDLSNSRYQVLPGAYPQVFNLFEHKCIATLIRPQWAITAAHCRFETPLGESMDAGKDYSVFLGRQPNYIDAVFVHPSFDTDTSRSALGVDLALLHLKQEQNIHGVSLYDGDQEKGQVAMFLGWGVTGNGLTDRRVDDATFRRAWNVVSAATHRLEFIFDDPRGLSVNVHPFEGMPGRGDSGGPALIEGANGLILIGVARGELLRNKDSVKGLLYGSEVIYERVSLHREWLNQVIGEN